MKEDAVISYAVQRSHEILTKFIVFLSSGIKEGRGILNDHGSLPWDEQLELLSKDEVRLCLLSISTDCFCEIKQKEKKNMAFQTSKTFLSLFLV